MMARDDYSSYTVLVVDDEALIAFDLADTVEELGFKVLGPATSLKEADGLIDETRPCLALLDIDVGGTLVWPLARRLVSLGCRPVFVSANHNHQELKSEFSCFAKIDKPASANDVHRALALQAAEAA